MMRMSTVRPGVDATRGDPVTRGTCPQSTTDRREWRGAQDAQALTDVVVMCGPTGEIQSAPGLTVDDARGVKSDKQTQQDTYQRDQHRYCSGPREPPALLSQHSVVFPSLFCLRVVKVGPFVWIARLVLRSDPSHGGGQEHHSAEQAKNSAAPNIRACPCRNGSRDAEVQCPSWIRAESNGAPPPIPMDLRGAADGQQPARLPRQTVSRVQADTPRRLSETPPEPSPGPEHRRPGQRGSVTPRVERRHDYRPRAIRLGRSVRKPCTRSRTHAAAGQPYRSRLGAALGLSRAEHCDDPRIGRLGGDSR